MSSVCQVLFTCNLTQFKRFMNSLSDFFRKGWQGDLCDVPICRKGCDPMHGYCKKPGECRCNLGFYGDKCDRCIPLPGCQHGYCNVSFECICNKGWDGLFCTDREL